MAIVSWLMVVKRTSFVSLVFAFFVLSIVGYADASGSDYFSVVSECRGHSRYLHTDFESIFLTKKKARFVQSFGFSWNTRIYMLDGVSELSQSTVRTNGVKKKSNAGTLSSEESEGDVCLSALVAYKNAIKLHSYRGLLCYLQLHLALALWGEMDKEDSPRVFDNLVDRRLEDDSLVYSTFRLRQLVSRLDWCSEFWRAALLLGLGNHSIFSEAKPVISLIGSYSWRASKLATCRVAMEVGTPKMLYPYHIYVGKVPCGYTKRRGYGTIPLSLFFANAFGVSLSDRLCVNFKSLYRMLSLSPSACVTHAGGRECVPASGRLAHGFGLMLDALVRTKEDGGTLSAGLAYTSGVVDHMRSVSLLYKYRFLSGYRVCPLYLKDGKVKNMNVVSLMFAWTYNVMSWWIFGLILDIEAYRDYFLDGMIDGVESGVRRLTSFVMDLSLRVWKFNFGIGFIGSRALLAKEIELSFPFAFQLGVDFDYRGKR